MSKYLSRIAITALRNSSQRILLSKNCMFDFMPSVSLVTYQNRQLFPNNKHNQVKNYSLDTNLALKNASIPLKKKTVYKKAVLEEMSQKEGHFLTMAYATANSYDLKGLKEALMQQKLYEPGLLTESTQEVGDVMVANAVYTIGDEPRQIIFFKEGAVVFWNCTELEAKNVLDFIKPFEIESYPREVVSREREVMTYFYQTSAKRCHLQESCFVLVPDESNSMEKYTFSHAMAQSARLGAWEARLEKLGDAVRSHTVLMEKEGAAKVDKKEIVRKLGELFSLRHRINVDSDLLDTPDFYWEEENLERLYSNTVAYFTIPRRTRVLNERLSHCVELLELLSSWAADRHHVRLEWMVIALIMAEVCFELLHYFERYEAKQAGVEEL